MRPTSGYRWNINSFPAFDTLNANRNFIRNELNTSYYQSLGKTDNKDETKESVLAMRLSGGRYWVKFLMMFPLMNVSLLAAAIRCVVMVLKSLVNLFQADQQARLSYYAASVETRIAWDDIWGNILFLDAGNVNIANSPDFKEMPRFAAGIGVRYYSDFFPFRADIGFPLNPRDRDDAFAFYIGIGEAF